jgi:hypothetical protein
LRDFGSTGQSWIRERRVLLAGCNRQPRDSLRTE